MENYEKDLKKNASKRIKQKRRLMTHLVSFIAGSIILAILNVLIGYQIDLQPLGMYWFVTAMLLWLFLLIIHAINVLVLTKFMGKEWEEKQMNRLMKKQLDKIGQLEKKVEQSTKGRKDNT